MEMCEIFLLRESNKHVLSAVNLSVEASHLFKPRLKFIMPAIKGGRVELNGKPPCGVSFKQNWVTN
jgi:hypothetical protein